MNIWQILAHAAIAVLSQLIDKKGKQQAPK
jgi:hypothetical protein